MSKQKGYLHLRYAESVALGEEPIALAQSGGWLVPRSIPRTEYRDAMAAYPFLVCHDWHLLATDIENLPGDIVSITAVSDPFSTASEGDLRKVFPNMVRPYKQHFVIDLRRPLSDFADPHHLGCARRALRKLEVEIVQNPLSHLQDWLRLYENLVVRHSIRETVRMTEEMFRRLFFVPGLTMFRASRLGETVGMIMCVNDGEHAYFHLGAYDDLGYRWNASYAIVHTAIEHFAAAGLTIMNIGAGAGAFATETDGLTTFKRGWASGSRTVYLCGRINNPESYAYLVERTGTIRSCFFPAYRGEQHQL